MSRTAARLLSMIVALVCAVGSGTTSNALSAVPNPIPFRLHVFRFVDSARTIRLPNGRRVPRPLETVVRVPQTQDPQPLVVFAHGFALTPATYTRLLDAWAHAGYVVAAPIFPLGNANAPGGPNEADLINQPRDMSFVITQLLAQSGERKGALVGRIDPARVAVAGHSDGGLTALAAAYDRRFRDERIRAAIVLSGAALGGMGAFPSQGPPLFAVQGTADPINTPANTASFFRRAHRPKFLLWLFGASHRPPYTDQQPQLGIVEQATTAFLDHYLRGGSLDAFEQAAKRPGLTRFTARP